MSKTIIPYNIKITYIDWRQRPYLTSIQKSSTIYSSLLLAFLCVSLVLLYKVNDCIVLSRRLKTEIDHHAQAVVSAGGVVTWIQPAVYVIRCRHEFRGNSWVAGFQLGSWTYDEHLLDLQPLPLPLGSAKQSSVSDDSEADNVDVDVASFSSNDHWAMLDHAGRREVRTAVCCADPQVDHFSRYQSPTYVSLHYLLKLRKKLGPSLLGRRRWK